MTRVLALLDRAVRQLGCPARFVAPDCPVLPVTDVIEVIRRADQGELSVDGDVVVLGPVTRTRRP